jgi:hypothetical protein
MEHLDTPQGRLDVVARLIARDAVIGRLPSDEMVDRYWMLRDEVARAAVAGLTAVA